MTPQRIAAIVAMLSASAVYADGLVDRADANGDGYVSLYELRAAYYADLEFNQRIEQSFADYDSDGDGLISETERRAQGAEAAEIAPKAETAPTAAVETAPIAAAAEIAAIASVATPGADTVADKPGSSGALEPSPPNARRLSRSETMIQEIDADNSGGASQRELVASGDGRQWFPNTAFVSADRNSDGDLDPDELEVLLQSMERRRRGGSSGRGGVGEY